MSTRGDYETIPTSNEQSHSETSLLRDLSFKARLQHFIRNLINRIHQNGIKIMIFSAFVFFLLLLIGLATFLPIVEQKQKPSKVQVIQPISPGISLNSLQKGLAKCRQLKKSASIINNNAINSADRKVNPRAPKNIRPVLLKNAIVWDGQGEILNHVDILMTNGVISQVKQNISQVPFSTKIVDVGGHIVSPGLVDMHTHLGVSSWPDLSGTSDTNEKTQPDTPFVRTIDAFNPSDKAIRIVNSGGITTVLVLPGSSNAIGGEAYTFKLRPVDTLSNEDMLVQAGIDEEKEHKWRYMKMACGENPKNNYGRQGRLPSTRMGEAYLFRQSFANAEALVRAQDDWCVAANNLGEQNDQQHLNSPFPENLSLESLAALLRGQVKLNIHCYETHDIEAMVRHSNEFQFNISSFHHALEAYKIPSILKRARNNITVATFADHWGYKKEAFGASPHGPKLLYEAGIPVALKSDHPVLNSQHMAFEAAKAAHYGLPPQEAFKAITSIPAQSLGLGHRVGSLKVGYDADVVIWDRSPLEIGATPLQVFVDGLPSFEEKDIQPLDIISKDFKKRTQQQSQLIKQIKEDRIMKNLPKEGSRSYLLTNVGSNLLASHNQHASTMLIKDGSIVCTSENCVTNMMDEEFETIDLQGGYVLPGLIAVGSKLGLVEIPSEGSTGDGIVSPSSSEKHQSIVEAVDGLKLGGKKLQEAYKGGVLTTISAPISRNIVIGVSAAFKTNAETILREGSIISDAAALHFQIGHSVKSSHLPTISSQISFIRRVLSDNIQLDNRFGQAARGEIPLIIMVNNKDEIASLIELKKKLIPKARMAIMGGAEAHLLASELAKANISVILRPHLCTPENFDSIHCLTGAPLTNGTAAHILHYHGVKIGLGITNDGWARNLAWDAGWLSATSPSNELFISELEAIKFVTTNLQEIFGLKESYGVTDQNQDFVVWSGSPMNMQSKPLFVHTKLDGIHYII